MTPSRTPDEEKLARRIESLTGGRVCSMERQLRHRPAWFVEVARGDEALRVYVRGDRASDVQPFPELRREAEILEVLEAHGIPVPHVHGMSEDPPAIVMQAVPGTRDVSQAANDEVRRRNARRYVETLVAMHRIPIEAFVEKGLRCPVGADQVALAGLDAYMPLYQRRKSRPEPLLEFAIGWLRRNVPRRRERASFVSFDAGQFLFDEHGLTALYDLEFALIGDPMADLATMALRDPVEPMGDEIPDLLRYYAELAGEPLDVEAVRYHQVLFSTVSCMQFAGAVADPAPGDPHETYLGWWIYLRRYLILTLSECIGIEPAAVEAPELQSGDRDPLIAMLVDTLRQGRPADRAEQARRRSALALASYLAETRRHGATLDRLACEEAEALLGERCGSRPELDARLEKRGATAAPEDDARLIRFFARDEERERLALRASPLARSADLPRLVPL